MKNYIKKYKYNKSIKELKKAKWSLSLPDVTLISVATKDVEETVKALEYSSQFVNFGSIKLVSYKNLAMDSSKIQFHCIDPIANIDEWSKKIIYELGAYIDTKFALLVHADGFVVNPKSWREDFLDYDYIGAPWPLPTDDFSYRDIANNIVRVGNSVSLRSKRLIDLPQKLNLVWEPFHGYYNEDGFICAKNRHIYEENGMKFAPLDIAKYFSHENYIPENEGIMPFAFHKWACGNSIYPKW